MFSSGFRRRARVRRVVSRIPAVRRRGQRRQRLHSEIGIRKTISALFRTVPAIRAPKLDPVERLRYQSGTRNHLDTAEGRLPGG